MKATGCHPLAACLLFGLMQEVSALVVTWTNTAGGDWNTAANWSPNQVPTAGDHAFITNAGTYTITMNSGSAATSILLGSASSTPTLEWTAGTISGALTIASNGFMRWLGGILQGTANVESGGGLALEGPAVKWIYSGTLTNAGLLTWTNTGNFEVDAGARLVNLAGGIVDIQNDQSLFLTYNPASSIQNAGLWRKSAGSGITTISVAFTNTGTVEAQSGMLNYASAYLQTAGLTLLRGANVTVNQPFQLLGGTLAGTNTFTGNVTNNGTVSPGVSPGRLTIAGHYTQTTNGTLFIELAGSSPGTNYDCLVVTGTANLSPEHSRSHSRTIFIRPPTRCSPFSAPLFARTYSTRSITRPTTLGCRSTTRPRTHRSKSSTCARCSRCLATRVTMRKRCSASTPPRRMTINRRRR